MAMLGTCIIASESLSVLMWVKNDTDNQIKVEFGSKTKKISTKEPFIIPYHQTKCKDLVLGTSLGWFTINENKYAINQNGTHWTIEIKYPYKYEKKIIAFTLFKMKIDPLLRWSKEKIIKEGKLIFKNNKWKPLE